jgi:hypothetical protein
MYEIVDLHFKLLKLFKVLGDPYSFALSQNWGPMVHPACRRFVLNLETQEFLEFHWYLHNDTLLANWMKVSVLNYRPLFLL